MSSGLTIKRRLTGEFLRDDGSVEDMFAWSRRRVEVKGDDGAVVFSGDVEAPVGWSDLAVMVAVRLYLRVVAGVQETSCKHMIRRVVDAIYDASKYPDVGRDYFASDAERAAFRDELFAILAGQYAAFNTPAWINVGVTKPKHEAYSRATRRGKAGRLRGFPAVGGTFGVYPTYPPNAGPQASACFIQGLKDDMRSILALQASEVMLFKGGSGTGTNLSPLRPQGSPLSGGGTASGPVSFMRGYDAWAGITKSGGSSRRAAKMTCLDVYHPDVVDFVDCKSEAQGMIRALGGAGYDMNYNAQATAWMPYQNANDSVRVDDAFMAAATAKDAEAASVQLRWPTQWGRDGGFAEGTIFGDRVDARQLLRRMAERAHDCGDPGLQFDTTMNLWHTSPAGGRQNATNPCSEFSYIDDSACNLASLRLTKFVDDDGTLDVALFDHVARVMFVAQEILVSASGYPTDAIAKNSRDFRPLGLGYADLGAFVMRMGLPYDSDRARGVGAALTALLGGVAYRTSAEIARDCGGPFPRYGEVKADMLAVMDRHAGYATKLALSRRASWLPVDMGEEIPVRAVGPVADAAAQAWNEARAIGAAYGFRNAQATVLAPTGSIGFLMDCDTTGIEPDTYLKKRKKLAGGGVVEYAGESVAPALRRLRYAEDAVEAIVAHVAATGRLPTAAAPTARGLRGGPHWVAPQDAAVFATAYDAPPIGTDGHLGMMAAAQPFLSGAISKTVALPNSSTPEDFERVFVRAWKLGLKAVALYRDGAKDQPLESAAKAPGSNEEASAAQPGPTAGAATEAASPGPLGAKIEVRGDAAARPGQVGKTVGAVLVRDVDTEQPELAQLRRDLAAARAELVGRRLPDDVPSLRHKFRLGGVACFMHVGFRADGTIGEIFVKLPPRAPNHLVVDLATKAASQALQRGGDAADISGDWLGADFEPRGFTGQGEAGIPWASSPLDYVARWIRKRSGGVETVQTSEAPPPSSTPPDAKGRTAGWADATSARPSCPKCGSPMVQAGTCLSCRACGHGEGGCGGG